MSEPTDIVDSEISEAVQNRENFEANIKNIWGYSGVGIEAKKAAMTMLSTKNGMYARIPIVCKADDCPYRDSCQLLSYDLAPLGEYCPIETQQIELRYAAYNDDFDLDESSFTDKNIVSEIINLDIMSERCKALIAKEGVPVIDVVSGIAENGETYSHPEISKYIDAYERTLRRRAELYEMMMATRKSRKKDGDQTKSLSEIISEAVTNGFVIEEKPTVADVVPVQDVDYKGGE